VASTVTFGGWLAGWLDLPARWREEVSRAQGWRRARLAAGAGGLSVLAFAPFFIWPVLFITLPVLVWLIDAAGAGRERFRSSAVAGWWFGFGYFFLGLFWIGEAFLVEADKFAWALPFAVTLMPAGLALFWGGAASLARVFWYPGFARILVLAVALGSAEWLRGHILTGFPWNALGYALTWPLVMMQGAGLLGIYGLSLWATWIFASPLVMIADAEPGLARQRGAFHGCLLAAVPLALLAAYGAVRLATPTGAMIEGVRLRLVQPSISQREKWQPENQGRIFSEHLELSGRDASGTPDGLKGITHVIWAEASMPFLPLEHPEALTAIGEMLPQGTQLIAGALRRERAQSGLAWRAFNGLMVFDDAGRLRSVYDKTHLVPFGEYLPQQHLLEDLGFEQLSRMRGGFSVGVTPRPVLDIQGLPKVGGLICYEAIFPGVGAAAAERPGLFINVTNDGWFGNTTGPRQHFHQTRVRAVEEGVPIVRVANNGISAVIDGSGRVLSSLSLNERGVLDSGVPMVRDAPPLVFYGDWVFVFSGAVFLLNAVLIRRCIIFFV
jgi:apolipoprotein N-acyltransferase